MTSITWQKSEHQEWISTYFESYTQMLAIDELRERSYRIR